jgi:DNA-binding IclR family transcriptional regulator
VNVPESDNKDLAPAVTRSIRILGILAESRGVPLGISEISREIGAAKSSTSNLCAVLEEGRLIMKRDGGYVLGHRTIELGGAFLSSFEQVPTFYRLATVRPELAPHLLQLAILDGTSTLFIARHEGHAPLRLSASIGDRFPASTTATGNALLTTLEDDEIRERFADPQTIPQLTDRSTKNLDDLLDRVAQARERGYAVDDGGVHPDVYGISVALAPLSSTGNTIALGVSLIKPDNTPDDRAHALEALLAARTDLENPLLPL